MKFIQIKTHEYIRNRHEHIASRMRAQSRVEQSGHKPQTRYRDNISIEDRKVLNSPTVVRIKKPEEETPGIIP
jgi:hypothetical protein